MPFWRGCSSTRDLPQGMPSGSTFSLRRMIICQEHGTGFHGRPHHRKWDYRCARISGARWYAERCTRYRLNGPSLEAKVWDQVATLLTNPSIIRAELTDTQESAAETELALLRTKGEVDKKLQRTYQHETHYARLTAQGELS